MTANHALSSVHLVAGCDYHRTIPPPIPTPPLGPHVVVWCLGWVLNPGTSKKNHDVQADWGMALGRQHDIGPGPYHFWPNALLPLVWLGAGNKSEWGSGTVKTPQGDMAVAVVPFVGINFQLDCWDFPSPPLPSSVAIASLCTVRAGFSAGDFWGGAFAMLFDMALTWVVNGIIAGVTGGLGKALDKGLGSAAKGLLPAVFNVGRASPSFWRTALYWLATDARAWWPAASNFVPAAVGVLLGYFGIGTPLGYSSSHSPVGGPAGDWNEAVHDYFEPPSAR